MKSSNLSLLLALVVIGTPPIAAGSDQYWSYSYRGIEVTSAGTSQYASGLAHDLRRLDLTLAQVLKLPKSDWQAPTRVYAVPHDQFSRLWESKEDVRSIFISSAFENDIVIDLGGPSENRFNGAYFGWTGSLLNRPGVTRFPNWFLKGLAEVFASSTIAGDRVTIGNFDKNRAAWLALGASIPLSKLFRITDSDLRSESADFVQTYTAECWFLAHLIVIEGQYNSNFMQFFAHLNSNQDQDAAFAASFTITYADLEKWFQSNVRAGKIRLLIVNQPDEVDPAEPRRLSTAEAIG